MTLSTIIDDSEIAYARRRHLHSQPVIRVLLQAQEFLTVALGRTLGRFRLDPDPLARALGRAAEWKARYEMERQARMILHARLEILAPRKRSHYTPELRFLIIEFMRKWGLSVQETANLFLIDASTIYDWLKDLHDHPGAKAIGTRLKPVPPLRRIGDATRRLAKQMHQAGFGGAGKVAQTLTRAAQDAISKTSAWRFRKERLVAPPPQISAPAARSRSITAKRAQHVVLMDVTEVPSFLGLRKLYVAAVLDVFSRMPLAWASYPSKPGAAQMASLLQAAVRTYGTPPHLITDQGGEFTGEEFTTAVARLHIKQRFGAVGKTGSISIIDRFFRTMKNDFGLKRIRPFLLQDLEGRLKQGMAWYAHLRPHDTFKGATPAEVYHGVRPRILSAKPAPTGRPGEPPHEVALEVEYLDPQHRLLPVLLKKAA